MNKVYDGLVLIMVALISVAIRDVIVFADSIGIAQTSGEIGDLISVDTVGVYEFPSADADTFNVGDIVYWDVDNKVVTLQSDSVGDGSGTPFPKAGTSWSVKAGGDIATINVKIG